MFSFAFLDWGLLATFSGAVGMTVILVQWLKLPLDRVWKIPTRFLVYGVCLAIMLLAQVFAGKGMNLEAVVLTVLNAVWGSFAAMSLYERTFEIPEQQKFNTVYQFMQTGEVPEDMMDALPQRITGTTREGESTTEEPPDGANG